MVEVIRDLSRVLAIDYGYKRTGLAWTDPLRISLNPLPTIETKAFKEVLAEYLFDRGIDTVVFGLPTHKDGTITEVGSTVNKLIADLQKKYPDILFETVDESFTSVRARQLLFDLGVKKSKRRQKGTVDQMSAVLILKEYLNI